MTDLRKQTEEFTDMAGTVHKEQWALQFDNVTIYLPRCQIEDLARIMHARGFKI